MAKVYPDNTHAYDFDPVNAHQARAQQHGACEPLATNLDDSKIAIGGKAGEGGARKKKSPRV